MPIQFKWGDFTFETGEATLDSYTVRAISIGSRKYKNWLRYTVRLKGMVLGDGETEVTTRINEIIEAFSIQPQNFTVLLSDGSTSPHSLVTNIGIDVGPYVKARSWDRGDIAELVKKREFWIELEQDVNIAEYEIIRYFDSIRYTGTGASFDATLQTQVGPRRQTIYPIASQRIVQYGESEGQNGYVTPWGPIDPTSLYDHLQSVTYKSPEVVRGVWCYYRSSWHYTMEPLSAIALNAPLPK